MSEIKPFTELLSEIIDNRGRTCPTSEDGITLIATNCINNDALYPTYEKARYVSQETYDTWFRGHPEPGDLIFVTKGSPGRVCLAPDPVDFCIAQDMVAVRPDPKKIYPKYLFAALRSHQVQQAIGNMHVGTLIPHFKKGDFDKLGIPVPKNDVQEVIGDMYFSLSAKIELNRRMNETLEAIARTMFKSWFVNFDPVRAKMNGEPPESICQRLGLTPDLLALFPDRLVDSELGETPEGWATESLYEMATYINGAAYKSFEPNEEQRGLPIIKIAELKGGLTAQTKYSDVEMPEKYKITRGDILFSWSGNPDTSIDIFVWANEAAWLNQHIFRVVPRNELERTFVLAMLKSMLDVFAEIARNKQTTGLGHVTVSDLKRLKCVKPPILLLVKWHEIIGPILERTFLSEVETQLLANHRDALLPKLLSGELRVPDAEKALEVIA